jgi:hypothetical protein
LYSSRRELRLEDDIDGIQNPVEIRARNPIYEHVQASISFAMYLMYLDSSRKALAEMGSEALKEWYGDDALRDDETMRRSVRNFLTQLNQKFISIRLSDEYAVDGSYLPISWYDPWGEERDEWTPRLGGTMTLNRHVRTSSPDPESAY